jgi:hypothetical protein
MRRSFAPEGGDGGGLKEQSIVTRYIVCLAGASASGAIDIVTPGFIPVE